MNILGLNLFNSSRIERNLPPKLDLNQNQKYINQTIGEGDSFSITRVAPKAKRPSFGSGYDVLLNKAIKGNDYVLLCMGLKRVPDLECGYCGAKMMGRELAEKISEEDSWACGEYLVKTLKKISEYIHPDRLKLINDFIAKAKENPRFTINKIIDIDGVPKKVSVMTKQLRTLLDLKSKYAKYCSSEDKKAYKALIDNLWDLVSRQFAYHSYMPSAIKSAFVANYPKSMLKNMSEETFIQFQRDVAKLEMPLSIGDAFLAQYSESSANKVLNRLLAQVMPTIEHVRPKSASGENVFDNIITVCKCCNHKRGSKSLSEFADEQPIIKSSLVSQFTHLGGLINGKLAPYISDVSKTIMVESGGKIDLTEFIK